jgi:hypothetical protein
MWHVRDDSPISRWWRYYWARCCRRREVILPFFIDKRRLMAQYHAKLMICIKGCGDQHGPLLLSTYHQFFCV